LSVEDRFGLSREFIQIVDSAQVVSAKSPIAFIAECSEFELRVGAGFEWAVVMRVDAGFEFWTF
jgi:hypothetical protein